MNNLLLIDGHSIMNRAFYGIPMLTNHEGIHTNAIYGFINIMLRAMEDEKSDHIAVAFDLKAPTFRHKMYEMYKGTRKPMPAELHEQVPVIKEILASMNIPVITLEGYEILKELGIKALVIIGGDDSNTNACVLAEYYAAKNYGVQVIGCPKTIDGDLKNDMIETSFGFDTACKTYSEVIGNIQRDCNSARKYWHFIKLMGRSASHIALECALQVQPNMCIISEEVEAKDMSLDDIVTSIAKVVAERAAQGNNFGTVLIPEGLVEFIPAMKRLIAELNDFLAANAEEFAQIKKSHQRDYIIRKLSPENAAIYASLPEGVARQLSLDRDPHGNVQVSLIETEKLLSEMVGTKLAQWKEEGKFVGKFAAQHHFFGYEGRCAAPSNFDADYCYSLGYTASMLIANGKTGYMSSVRNTTAPAEEWIAGGVPITMMMNMERRHGEMKPVIQKALVKLDGAPFKAFAAQRDRWAMETDYVYPGPIQYFGPTEVCDQATKTLQLEQAK